MNPTRRFVATPRTVASCGGVGLLLIATGSFLPWLRSGQVLRNSYAALGVLRRLVSIPGVEGVLLAIWPLLGLFCSLVAVIFAVGAHRIAACAALVPAVLGGILAAAALARSGTGLVQVVPLGPVLTLAGALLVVTTVTLVVVPRQAWPWRDDS